MENKHSSKPRGLFGRSKPKEEAAPAKPVASLLLILAGAAAQRLLSHHGKGSYTDTQIKAIATGLTRDLTTLSAECARQERLLRTREARQRLMLGLSLAGLLNVRDQLETFIARYTAQLMRQTNPEMPAVTIDPARSGVHTLPAPSGQIVDSTLVESASASASDARISPPQQPAPTLSQLTERELGTFANELRDMFAAIIQGVQVVLGALGSVESTGPAQIESTLAQTRALVNWIADEVRRLRTVYNIAGGAVSG